MTIATVLPVLGLAVLLVARAQMAGSIATSRRALIADGVVFGIALLGVLVNFTVSLYVLSGEWDDSQSLRQMAVNATVLAAVVLFLFPLVNLCLLIFRHPLTREARYYYRKVSRSLRERRRYAARMRRRLFRQYAELTDGLEEIAVALRERPFNPELSVADVANDRALLKSAARRIEQGIAESESERAEIERELLDTQREHDAMFSEIHQQLARSMWNLFSSSIGQTTPDDVSDDQTAREDETPKLIVARPAPRRDDPPR